MRDPSLLRQLLGASLTAPRVPPRPREAWAAHPDVPVGSTGAATGDAAGGLLGLGPNSLPMAALGAYDETIREEINNLRQRATRHRQLLEAARARGAEGLSPYAMLDAGAQLFPASTSMDATARLQQANRSLDQAMRLSTATTVGGHATPGGQAPAAASSTSGTAAGAEGPGCAGFGGCSSLDVAAAGPNDRHLAELLQLEAMALQQMQQRQRSSASAPAPLAATTPHVSPTFAAPGAAIGAAETPGVSTPSASAPFLQAAMRQSRPHSAQSALAMPTVASQVLPPYTSPAAVPPASVAVGESIDTAVG